MPCASRAGADEDAKKDPISECISSAFSVIDFEILAQASFITYLLYMIIISIHLKFFIHYHNFCYMNISCSLAARPSQLCSCKLFSHPIE